MRDNEYILTWTSRQVLSLPSRGSYIDHLCVAPWYRLRGKNVSWLLILYEMRAIILAGEVNSVPSDKVEVA